MTHHRRRFELLLPLRLPDGTAVPRSRLVELRRELEYELGGKPVETQIVAGLNRETGETEERGVVFRAETRESAEQLAYFFKLKGLLDKEFGEGEVRVTTFPVGVL